jgi:hypothetical protein
VDYSDVWATEPFHSFCTAPAVEFACIFGLVFCIDLGYTILSFPIVFDADSLQVHVARIEHTVIA